MGAELLKPLWTRLGELTLTAHVLGVDDTPMKVLDRTIKAGVRRGHIWAYVGYEEGKPVWAVHRYTPDWKGVGPCTFLKERTGYIQGDAYAGIDTLFEGPQSKAIRVGCMAHSRRRFEQALERKDKRAAAPLELFGKLYHVERLATRQEATPEQRLKLREQYSRPVMVELGKWLELNRPRVEPKSLLGKAITYAVNQWTTLLVYLTDGAISIDNNNVEQRMRPVAVGRKNYLFCGSDEGAERAAILYTIVACCKLAAVEPEAYLRDVITRLSGRWPASRLDELLPENWQPLTPAETPAA